MKALPADRETSFARRYGVGAMPRLMMDSPRKRNSWEMALTLFANTIRLPKPRYSTSPQPMRNDESSMKLRETMTATHAADYCETEPEPDDPRFGQNHQVIFKKTQERIGAKAPTHQFTSSDGAERSEGRPSLGFLDGG